MYKQSKDLENKRQRRFNNEKQIHAHSKQRRFSNLNQVEHQLKNQNMTQNVTLYRH